MGASNIASASTTFHTLRWGQKEKGERGTGRESRKPRVSLPEKKQKKKKKKTGNDGREEER